MRHSGVLISLVLCAVLCAQESDQRRWVFVTTPENVSDADHQLGEIEILQDGHPLKQARPLIQQHMPVRIGLVFDESGFSRLFPSRDLWMDRVLNWAGDTVQRHKGDIFLVGFNDQVVTSTQITGDISQLHLALGQMRSLGRSALRDAILHGSEKFNAVRPETQPMARLLVIVGDGHDRASYAKERDVLESSQRNGVRIYAIGWPPAAGTPGGGKKLLEYLAVNTGGQAFFPSDQNDLDRVLAAIDRAITNSFLLGFIPESRDGKPHRLTVKLPKAEPIDFRYISVSNSPPAP
jgi:VWFA-related protein